MWLESLDFGFAKVNWLESSDFRGQPIHLQSWLDTLDWWGLELRCREPARIEQEWLARRKVNPKLESKVTRRVEIDGTSIRKLQGPRPFGSEIRFKFMARVVFGVH